MDVSSATTYSSSSGTLSGLSALKTGENVIVQGTTSGSVVKATVRASLPCRAPAVASAEAALAVASPAGAANYRDVREGVPHSRCGDPRSAHR